MSTSHQSISVEHLGDRRGHWIIWTGLIVTALIVIVLYVLAGRSNQEPISERTSAHVYANAMADAFSNVVQTMEQMNWACSDTSTLPSVDRCVRGIDIAAKAIPELQGRMSGLHAPECLRDADATLRRALVVLEQGYSATRGALSQRNISDLGLQQVENGNELVNEANRLLRNAASSGACST